MIKKFIDNIIIIILLVINFNVFYFIFKSDFVKNFFVNKNSIASIVNPKNYSSVDFSDSTNYQKINPDSQKNINIENDKNNLNKDKGLTENKFISNDNKEQFLDNDLFYFEEIRKNLKINTYKDNFSQYQTQSSNKNIDFTTQIQFFNKDNNLSGELINLQQSSNSLNIMNNSNLSLANGSSSDNNLKNNYYDFFNKPISIQNNKDNNVVSSSSRKNDTCEEYKLKNYPKIFISEVKFGSDNNPYDEYIELYNPNDIEIDLTCWSLEKYSAKQNLNSLPDLITLLPASKFKGIIKPYSFFLITSSSTKEKYKGDLNYAQSYSLAKNNSIILKKPNGEIADMIGYGDNREKIYQSEAVPFLSQNFENKSIQRKNLQDLDNNLDDFWLRKLNPENSTFPMRKPRVDFIDLRKINIDKFQISIITDTEKTLLKLVFSNPMPNIYSTNYRYNLLITDLSSSSSFGLTDFGSTATLSFLQSEYSNNPEFVFETTIEKCPLESTHYYVKLGIYDLLDEENIFISATSSIKLPDNLCSVNFKVNTSSEVLSGSYFKIFISEVKIIEGDANGEYIELYNPNTASINLAGWKLLRYNSENKASTIISDHTKAKFKDITMQPFSYLLLSNTTTLLINGENIKVDLVYALSHDLAKNNSLVLINDKDVVIDQFSWNKVSNDKSYSRKKIDVTNEDNYFTDFKDLGNAYDTDNSSDFILVDPNPQNLSVSKSIPFDISMFKGEFDSDNNLTSSLNIMLSWITPFVYDNVNYEYKLFFATSSDNFYPLDGLASFVLPQFQALSLQKVEISNLNINSLTPEENFDINNLKFKLELYKNNNKMSEVVYFKN